MAARVEPKADRLCHICRRGFRDPSTLRRHLEERKKPCAPVVDEAPPGGPAPLGGPPPPAEKRCHCRFCGRSYSNQHNVRRHMASCPVAARGDRGMDVLYAHVLERTRRAREQEEAAAREVEALRGELRQARLEVATRRDAGVVIYAPQNTFVTNINVINVFGQEDTGRITTASVREILARCGAAAPDAGGATAAAQAILQAALLIYSDAEHPKNITCYIPTNKRDGNALVHGAQGWEIRPAPLILPPMARTSLDLLFDKQPFEDAARYGELMIALRDNEQAFAQGKQMRTILVSNKALLDKALGSLPR